jgi:invasion protein IalB
MTFISGAAGRLGMIESLRNIPVLRVMLLAALLVALATEAGCAYAQQPAQTENEAGKADGPEFRLLGRRDARSIKYGDWRKFCFKTPGANRVCRTTISGIFETGQTAVRVDLIERDGDQAARLQLFLPVGLYLQAGVKITIDQEASHRIPYVWCLTNTCIAADLANPRLIQELESGQKLTIEVVDSSVLAISTSLPLGPFAAVHQGDPVKVFEQAVDE